MADYMTRIAKLEERRRNLALMESKLRLKVSKQKRKAENQAKIILGSVLLKNGTKAEIEKLLSLMAPIDKEKVTSHLRLARPEDFPEGKV